MSLLNIKISEFRSAIAKNRIKTREENTRAVEMRLREVENKLTANKLQGLELKKQLENHVKEMQRDIANLQNPEDKKQLKEVMNDMKELLKKLECDT